MVTSSTARTHFAAGKVRTAASKSSRRYFLLLVPVIVFNAIAFVAPLLIFGSASFRPAAGPAEIGAGLTFENWTLILTDPIRRNVFVNSALIICGITLGCLVIGVPISYVIARTKRWGGVLILAVIASSFISAVVQSLGWLVLLSGSGPLIGLLDLLGFSADDIRILQTPAAVIIGLIHAELHYMVLVCTPAFLAISRQLEHAAMGLGASWFATVRRVVLPLAWPGILGGALLVLATSAGSFTTPALLGGGLVPWAPLFISDQMTTSLNYPMAATASIVLVAFVLIVSALASAITRKMMVRKGAS